MFLEKYYTPQVLKRKLGKYYRMMEENRMQQIKAQNELCRSNIIKYFEETPDWVLPYFDSDWRM